MCKNIKQVAVFLFCLFASSQACSQIEVKDYPHAKSSEWFKTYILGVGNGISWANSRPNRASLYCPPGVLKLDADEYIAILDRQILDESKKPDGLRDNTPVELLLLRGLSRTFPCKQ